VRPVILNHRWAALAASLCLFACSDAENADAPQSRAGSGSGGDAMARSAGGEPVAGVAGTGGAGASSGQSAVGGVAGAAGSEAGVAAPSVHWGSGARRVASLLAGMAFAGDSVSATLGSRLRTKTTAVAIAMAVHDSPSRVRVPKRPSAPVVTTA